MRVVRRARIWGSSPLTRGKRRADRGGGGQGRLIPAHAGKTTRIRDEAGSSRAHPRSRGENVVLENRFGMGEGSSPLTRGKHGPEPREGVAEGLIPAHAGKTLPLACPPWSHRAHPRSRGENDRPPRGVRQAPGSSPLTRGKLRGVLGSSFNGRLIPAHAGKTQPSSSPT